MGEKSKLRHLKKKRVLTPLTISVVIAFLLGFWAGGLNPTNELALRERERLIGTDESEDFRFHAIVEDKQGYGLHFPGYVIGIEKTERVLIQAQDTSRVLNTATLPVHQREWAENRLDDEEILFVSHIVEYQSSRDPIPHMHSRYTYNTYTEKKQNNIFNAGYESLLSLNSDVKELIKDYDANHIVMVCMGWMTDQQEAIRDCNSIIGHLLEYRHPDTTFKPIVVLVSWPSHSEFDGVNYPIKADDADEVGIHWINTLLRKTLQPIRQELNIPITCIGHSLGSRALSSGIFLQAEQEVKQETRQTDESVVDLLLCYSGAYSINRFLGSGGMEGGPYSKSYHHAKTCVLTYSKSDMMTSLPSVYNTPHIGGYPAAEIAAQHPSLFHLCTHQDIVQHKGETHIIYVDMSQIMKYSSPQRKSGAHGDIFRPETAVFLNDVFKLSGAVK